LTNCCNIKTIAKKFSGGERKIKMEQYAWILWIVLGVSLIIAEIFTLGFVMFWFGIGALAAALLGYLGFGVGVQFLVFAAVSIALTLLSRQIFHGKYLTDGEENIKTGVDSLPGQIGMVTGASKGSLNAGEVKVFGSTWTAFPEAGEEPLSEGEKVEVVGVKGASIYVKRVRELPEWREGS
jgi:membrane protein implicated in regulation of membrane protease activity